MKRLIWLWAIVYLATPLRAELFELLQDDAEDHATGNNNDFIGEAISGVKQYLAGLTEDDDDRSNNKTAATVIAFESGAGSDEVDTALKHATDTADGLWQQFKKGLLSLMGSFSAGDDGGNDIDGYNATTTTTTTRTDTILPMAITTDTPSLQQMKPIANQTSAIIEDLTTTTSKPIPLPLQPTTTTATPTPTIASPTSTATP